MSAIIWWLESPWQLRALVFILSFFVCFAGPWLHSQSLLTSRLAARKSLAQNTESVPAPLQEKATVQPSQASPKPEAPVEEKQTVIKPEAPVQGWQPTVKEEASAKPEAPAQEKQAAIKPEAAVQGWQPAVKEEAPAQAAGKAKAPALEPALSAAPAAQHFSGGFDIVSKSTAALPIPGGGPVEKQEFAVSTEHGGAAIVDAYVLSNRASWAIRRSDRFVDSSNRRTDLSAVLDSDAFAKAAAAYDAVICVGLGSRSTTLSPQEVMRLIDHRAVHLCGVLSRKPYVSANAKLYGLPLGQHVDQAANMSETEKKQRSLIIIGIRSAKGDLADAAVQKKMISEIVRSDRIANFPLSSYSEAAPGKELRYIEVKGGSFPYKNRPVSPLNQGPAKTLKGGLKDTPVKLSEPRPSAKAWRALPIAGRRASRPRASQRPPAGRAGAVPRNAGDKCDLLGLRF